MMSSQTSRDNSRKYRQSIERFHDKPDKDSNKVLDNINSPAHVKVAYIDKLFDACIQELKSHYPRFHDSSDTFLRTTFTDYMYDRGFNVVLEFFKGDINNRFFIDLEIGFLANDNTFQAVSIVDDAEFLNSILDLTTLVSIHVGKVFNEDCEVLFEAESDEPFKVVVQDALIRTFKYIEDRVEEREDMLRDCSLPD